VAEGEEKKYIVFFPLKSPNKIGEAYTEKCAGRRGFADPENWHSRQLRNQKLRSVRGLTPTEANTEAFDLVRMWRASGVKRLWHVHRDAFENLRDPFIPLMILFPKIEMLKTRSVVETVLRWWPRIMNVHEESCETRNWDDSRWLSGSRINHSTLRLGEPTTWGRI
jgi:hypothetical protein